MPTQYAPDMLRLLQFDEEHNAPGIDLPPLCSQLLRQALAAGRLSMEDARGAAAVTSAHLYERMRHLFRDKDEDGVQACLRTILGQLTLQGLLRQSGPDLWVPTAKVKVGERLKIVHDALGWQYTLIEEEQDHSGVGERLKVVCEALGVPYTPGEEEQAKSSVAVTAAKVRSDIAAIAHLIEPGGRGLRPLVPEHVQDLYDSVREHGILPHAAPIIYDQYGRTISGRHREAAEARLIADGILGAEPTKENRWPRKTVHVENDAQAIQWALGYNVERPLAHRDFEYLKRLGLGSTKTETQRRLVALALLEDAQRSDREIARLIGCDKEVVARIRTILEANGEENGGIRHFDPQRGRGHTRRKAASPVQPNGHKEPVGVPPGTEMHAPSAEHLAAVERAAAMFREGLSREAVARECPEAAMEEGWRRVHPDPAGEAEALLRTKMKIKEVHVHFGYPERTRQDFILQAWERLHPDPEAEAYALFRQGLEADPPQALRLETVSELMDLAGTTRDEAVLRARQRVVEELFEQEGVDALAKVNEYMGHHATAHYKYIREAQANVKSRQAGASRASAPPPPPPPLPVPAPSGAQTLIGSSEEEQVATRVASVRLQLQQHCASELPSWRRTLEALPPRGRAALAPCVEEIARYWAETARLITEDLPAEVPS